MESTTFIVLTAVSLLSMMVMMRKFLEILPSLLAGVIRWKENMNMEASVKLSRDRNLMAMTMILPFCIVVSVKELYSPEFLERYEAGGIRIWLIISIFIGYLLLRAALERVCHPKKMNRHIYRCANRSANTFFIILSLTLLSLCGLFSVLNVGPDSGKDAMLWISAIIYTLFLIRKYQIFISSCSIFAGFLYLCALEILPTGVVVASAVIF